MEPKQDEWSSGWRSSTACPGGRRGGGWCLVQDRTDQIKSTEINRSRFPFCWRRELHIRREKGQEYATIFYTHTHICIDKNSLQLSVLRALRKNNTPRTSWLSNTFLCQRLGGAQRRRSTCQQDSESSLNGFCGLNWGLSESVWKYHLFNNIIESYFKRTSPT